MSNQRNIPRPAVNGVLQVTASQTAATSRAPASRAAGPRLKVVIRRLAPGLTEAEFLKILGDEWKTGQGKVDWFVYKPGKDSKDFSKPSRPSRAYFHLTSDAHLLSLSDIVKQLSFEDALNTWTSPSLLGAPTVEFAPYGRIPTGRRRTDARQGTIDQDPEFMDFLESLANPISTKEESGGEGPVKGEKVTTTPLVQFLKDKKANKGKEVAASKVKHSRQESQSKTILKAKDSPEKTGKDAKKDKLVEKAAREAVKILDRQAAAKTEPPKNPRAIARERGSVAAAARILQRDLGIGPGAAHRKAKADADTSKTEPATGPKAGPSTTKIRDEKVEETPKPASPVTLLKKPEPTPPKPAPPPPAKAVAPPRKAPIAVPSAGATKAFVKHANPSQGVTEALLKEAMEVFGAVTHVEIDKRKGFAYVDFVDPEGLIKAMAANPTKIAQGTVQVLERKDAKPAPAPAGPARGGFGRGGTRGGTVGRRGGRGGARADAAPANAPSGPSSMAPPTAPSGPSAK